MSSLIGSFCLHLVHVLTLLSFLDQTSPSSQPWLFSPAHPHHCLPFPSLHPSNTYQFLVTRSLPDCLCAIYNPACFFDLASSIQILPQLSPLTLFSCLDFVSLNRSPVKTLYLNFASWVVHLSLVGFLKKTVTHDTCLNLNSVLAINWAVFRYFAVIYTKLSFHRGKMWQFLCPTKKYW